MSDAVRNRGSDRPSGPVHRPIRWWPAVGLVGLAVAAVIVVRSAVTVSRQQRNIAVAEVIVSTGLLLLAWCLFFSRLPWRQRWSVLAVAVGGVCLTGLFFRVRGVTGDLFPILEPRWRHGMQFQPSSTSQPPAIASMAANPPTARTGNYPQFLGPLRNATLPGPVLARDWASHPPQRLWQTAVGAGWSGWAVQNGYAVTQEQRGSEECVVAYELMTGRELWVHADRTRYQTTLGGEGPRATPTIAKARVYALGAQGKLNCLELDSGRAIWSKDLAEDNSAKVPEWGYSGSPLVTGEWVVVSPGGHRERSLVAYRAATGEFGWGAGTDSAGYSSPALVTLAGVPQIVIFNAGGVVGHDPNEGRVLWRYPWRGGHPHVAMPVVVPEDRLLVSSGYGTGAELVQIRRGPKGEFTASRVWRSPRLKAKFANPVQHQGYIYGLDDGTMVCLDAASGELKWKEGHYGHGQNILVGNLLLVTAESGEVILLEATPNRPRELARFTVLTSKTWNPAALAGDLLLLRNDKEAACYRLPVQ